MTNPQASPLTNEQFAVSNPGGRDVFVFMQNAEPISLFCADETDGESLRACDQVMERSMGMKSMVQPSSPCWPKFANRIPI